MATEVAADALGEERRVTWSESVMGTTNKVFPRSKVCWPLAECACCRVRGVPVTDQGGLEGGSACLFVSGNLSALNLITVRKKERRIFVDWLAVSWLLEPKSASRIWKLFSLSKEMSTVVGRPRTKAAQTQHLVPPLFCNISVDILLWRNSTLRKQGGCRKC